MPVQCVLHRFNSKANDETPLVTRRGARITKTVEPLFNVCINRIHGRLRQGPRRRPETPAKSRTITPNPPAEAVRLTARQAISPCLRGCAAERLGDGGIALFRFRASCAEVCRVLAKVGNCTPPACPQRTQSRRSRSTPAAAAESGSKQSETSTYAATSPRAVASARSDKMTLVPPDDVSPVISLISPRGNPPPIKASKSANPVGAAGYAVTLLGKEDPNPCRRSKVWSCSSWAEAVKCIPLLFAYAIVPRSRPKCKPLGQKIE